MLNSFAYLRFVSLQNAQLKLYLLLLLGRKLTGAISATATTLERRVKHLIQNRLKFDAKSTRRVSYLVLSKETQSFFVFLTYLSSLYSSDNFVVNIELLH